MTLFKLVNGKRGRKMAERFNVSLVKIIREFNLETIYLPKKAEEIMIDENDVNRPGLQLMGFYEYFDPERIQIIGKMEFAYLSTIDEKTRYQRLEALFHKIFRHWLLQGNCHILMRCWNWQKIWVTVVKE